jgi:hypothetical protein
LEHIPQPQAARLSKHLSQNIQIYLAKLNPSKPIAEIFNSFSFEKVV